tara:strand:- start:16 stop:168 length:153 start_codon:yes stop_codon:yes gene_type:complete
MTDSYGVVFESSPTFFRFFVQRGMEALLYELVEFVNARVAPKATSPTPQV